MTSNLYPQQNKTPKNSFKNDEKVRLVSAETYHIKTLILWVPVCLLMAWMVSNLSTQVAETISQLFLISGLALWGIGLAIHLFSSMLLSNLKNQEMRTEHSMEKIAA